MPSSLAAGTVGVPYSQALGASGGTPPYSWTVASGTLPAGLSLAADVRTNSVIALHHFGGCPNSGVRFDEIYAEVRDLL